MKKIHILSAAMLLSMLSVSGCGTREEGEQEDTTKAQLSVITFDGGVGDQWLKNAARLFEEKNKDRTDFQDGRTGVQIHIAMDRSVGGDTIKMSDLNKDIYFTENVDYYFLTNQDKFADITDILTTPNSEDGGKKIIDKIDGNLSSFLNRDGKYYAIPFYDCFYGLIYDKDLFKDKGFYMKDDGLFTSNESEFGKGPNGVAGDWDDGLPATYAQFDSMIDLMVAKKVIPFTYSSAYYGYTYRALSSFWADDEGYDDANLNYTFNGTAHNIVDSITDGVATTKSVEITKENGYLLRSQAGLYNALSFARNILCDTSSNYQSYSTNYDVQTAFINNKWIGGSTKPIAMMFEGTWWENEAADAFDLARSSYAAESFNYGFMPIPKSSESKIGDATLLNQNNSFGFIASNSQNMKLAKEFMSFLHTDEQLRAFTVETNMTRGLSYSLTAADREKISTYAKNLIDIKESEHTKILYPYCGLDFVINNGSTFSNEYWIWNTAKYTNSPITKFIDDKTLSAKDFFEDHASLIKSSEWARLIK